MLQIAICAAGAAILALFIVWAFVRAARRPFMKSAPTARERIGAGRVDWGDPKEPFKESELKAGMPSRWPTPTPERVAAMRNPTLGAWAGQNKRPGLRAVDSVRRPVNEFSSAPYADWLAADPLNPISPLHHVIVDSPAAVADPAPSHHHEHCSPSQPDTGTSSWDSGSSSSSCDSSSSSSDSGSPSPSD